MLINWQVVENLANDIKSSQGHIDSSLASELLNSWKAIKNQADLALGLRFYDLFEFLQAGLGEQWGFSDFLLDLKETLAQLAEFNSESSLAGRFWHDYGQQLHRLARHEEARQAFIRSASAYAHTDDQFHCRESIYMQALCLRALGFQQEAYRIIEEVLVATEMSAWRIHPLIVKAWLLRDFGELKQATSILEAVLAIIQQQEQSRLNQLLYIQTLTDLADIQGQLHDFLQGKQAFNLVLQAIQAMPEPDYRQLARTYLKMAKLMRLQKLWADCLQLLQQADLIVMYTPHKELAVQIELERLKVALARRKWTTVIYHFQLALRYLRTLGFGWRALVRRFANRIRK